MSEVIFSDQNWQNEVIESTIPVMIDFWAAWCAPCFMIAPAVEELSQQFQDKIKVGKLNVDENPNVAGKYGIRSIPTLLFFHKGELVDRLIGAVAKEIIEEKINQILEVEITD